jgi:general secretion pathway protein B
MSFILDALKKSESERNRQSGPVLLEVRVAPPRSRLPVWAIVLGVALLANALVLGYLLLRPATTAPAPPPTIVTVPAAVVAPVATPPQVAPAVATVAPPVTTGVLPDPSQPGTPLPDAAGSSAPNAADYEPAITVHSPASPSAGSVAADMGLPTLNDLNASGANLPELRLSLHVYDADPARRYVLLNSTRLREGESTPDGIRLERVTESGVILSWRNRRFTLQRGE